MTDPIYLHIKQKDQSISAVQLKESFLFKKKKDMWKRTPQAHQFLQCFDDDKSLIFFLFYNFFQHRNPLPKSLILRSCGRSELISKLIMNLAR